jgi:hypothetical protein
VTVSTMQEISLEGNEPLYQMKLNVSKAFHRWLQKKLPYTNNVWKKETALTIDIPPLHAESEMIGRKTTFKREMLYL